MYKSKADVDKHVETLVQKLSLKEFKSRTYSVARLYFEVGDYTSCQRYVEQYIGHKDNNAAAYKLLAQTLCKLGDKEKALDKYRTSLEIDPSQTSLILDICELLADNEVYIDPSRAQYWCEKAESTFPRHPTTYRLRERLIVTANPHPEAIIDLLLAEMGTRPRDVSLHSRLIKFYLEAKRIKDAFNHSFAVEFGEHNSFTTNYAWYEALSEVLSRCDQVCNIDDWQYQLLLLTVSEKLCAVSLSDVPSGSAKSLVESANLLHQYDQLLTRISQARASGVEFHSSLLQHHRGQFCLHAATFLLKKAKKDQINWRDASKAAAPLMLMAWHVTPIDIRSTWVTQSVQKEQTAVKRWHLEGSFRCSQAGHYLLANVQDRSHSFLDRISEYCAGSHWKEKLYDKLFTNKDHLRKIKQSNFVSNNFPNPILRLPRKTEVESYDETAQKMFPCSLHHVVWILVNYKNFAHFKCTLFDMLIPKSQNYPHCGPETLNKYDAYSFLYCSALSAQQHAHNNKFASYHSGDEPNILPASITNLLCSYPQMKWWDCAYKVSINEFGPELTDVRATLSRGIEVVRCIDNHGLDPKLLSTLGQIFADRAQSSLILNIDEKNQLKSRAVIYYKSAIPLLERLKNKIAIKFPEKRMFEYTHAELNPKELTALIEESKLYVGINYYNENDYEKAIELLTNLKSPYACYYLGEIYSKLAQEELSHSEEAMAPELHSKHALFLSKAKEFAYTTLERLKNSQEDTKKNLYQNTHQLLETIEIEVNKRKSEFSNANDYQAKYSSDDESTHSSPTEHVRLPLQNNSNYLKNACSTPNRGSTSNATYYKSAIDSQVFEISRNELKTIERLDNQIKLLQKKDTSINAFVEQTKSWIEQNKSLGLEVRELKNTLNDQFITSINSNIQNMIDQFKVLKMSVDKFNNQIVENRSESKNEVVELKKEVEELKKEMSKLKTASSEQTIDESDLYNLEDEYRARGSTPTFAAQLPFTTAPVLTGFNQRIVPPVAIPPGAYSLYSQNLYNLYNQYSQLAQPPAVPNMPLFENARVPTTYPGVYQTPEHMFPDIQHLIPPLSTPAVSVQAPSVPAVSVIRNTNTSKSKEPSQAFPANVVITSSDPLPTRSSVPQPVLSVTIPPEHIKGNTPHNYQIPMPSVSENSLTPSIFTSDAFTNKSKPFTTLWPQTTSAEVTHPMSLNTTPRVSLSQDSSKFSLFDSPKTSGLFDKVDGTPNESLNKSRTLSEKSNTSIENYDPCPDFKPIIPLPAEVKVTTGEEDEVAVFSARAKLYRFVDKQWKERGIGEMKLLKHKDTSKVRVLMRREQVHKVCANHLITPDIKIEPMKNETKAYFWVANDFADSQVVLEKFCIRFKTAEIAKDFFEAFEKARKEVALSPTKPDSLNKDNNVMNLSKSSNEPAKEKKDSVQSHQDNKTVVGGFTFSGTPSFRIVSNQKEDSKPTNETKDTKMNPFSGVTFKTNAPSPFVNLFGKNEVNTFVNQPTHSNETQAKANTSDLVEEFEPTVDFKPVIPLPALVETKTGEEDENVLFEHRAKLLRFESSTKEWKERGLGIMKLLVNRENNQKLRLLMRREQVMKVCCNHAITKDMVFQKMSNLDKAVTWCAQDFSEGELISETFCLRFKTVNVCNDFIEAIKSAQSKLKDSKSVTDTKAIKEEQNTAKQTDKAGFGDMFKPKAGSWHCDQCYTNNLESFAKCACCETPRPGTDNKDNSNPVSSLPVTVSANWGDKFKPKSGTWECQQCFVRNENNATECSACSASKDPNVVKAQPASIFGGTENQKFNFGIPQNKMQNQPTAILNFAPMASKPTDEPKTFSFGIKPTTVIATPLNVAKAEVKENTVTVQKPVENTGFKFTTATVNTTIAHLLNAPAKVNPTPASFAANKTGPFEFHMTPKANVNKTKSPVASPKSDDSDGEYKSDDEGHHIQFTPVIPLPDKVEVTTGEEDEEEHFSQRAKLFRFVGGEWKERGLGLVKILKHKNTGKLRVLMRRERVLKICLNHALTPEIMYMPKDEKTWLFTANDFSEGELCLQQFCLRFKTKENAEEFKEAADKARTGPDVHSVTNKESDDVLFINKIEATSAEKLRAKELMLPENFFTYKDKTPCQGCRGCEDSDDNKTLTVFKTPSKPEASPASSKFTTPSVNRTPDSSVFRTPLESIGPNSNFATPVHSGEGIASNSFVENKENALTPKSIFGDKSLQNSALTLEQGKSPTISLFSNANSSKGDSKGLLAPPKLSSTLTPDSSTAKTEPKSIFGTTPEDTTEAKVEVKSIFGVTSASETKTDATPAIFGTNAGTGSSLFGNKSIFGSKPDTSTSIFGGKAETPYFGSKPMTASIFGGNSDATPAFGTNTSSNSIFGTQAAAGDSKPSIFGTNSKPLVFGTGAKPTFGSNAEQTQAATSVQKPEVKSTFNENQDNAVSIFSGTGQTSIFGGQGFGTNNQAKTNGFFSKPGSLFENKPTAQSIFGDPALKQNNEKSTNLFTNIAKEVNASKPASNATDDVCTKVEVSKASTIDSETAEAPFPIASAITFADLTSAEAGFEKKEGFQWEGAGQQLFGGKKAQANVSGELSRTATSEADDSGVGAGASDEYDPHYEPIVPLPDKIVVTTGEEDEEKMFGERAKLYRYDDSSREWKERGVGELKLLFHPSRKTYRLLLRREQVHKAVLNTLVHKDLELLPMKNSDRAWTWAAVNYAEEAAGVTETLAVRFKSTDLAINFKDKVTQAVRSMQAMEAQKIREEKEAQEKTVFTAAAPLRLPKTLNVAPTQDNNLFSVPQQVVEVVEVEDEEEGDDDEHQYDYEDYESYYNEEEEDGTVMSSEWSGAAQVVQGSTRRAAETARVQLVFDAELCVAKLLLSDEPSGELLADVPLYPETTLQMSGAQCTWSGTDYTSDSSEDKTVTVTFADDATAQHFYDVCQENKGYHYAQGEENDY